VKDLGPGRRIALGRVAATRRQLSSMVWSFGVPSASFSRYFMSQICWAMGASGVMAALYMGSVDRNARIMFAICS
jgi:hypothetical protein